MLNVAINQFVFPILFAEKYEAFIRLWEIIIDCNSTIISHRQENHVRSNLQIPQERGTLEAAPQQLRNAIINPTKSAYD